MCRDGNRRRDRGAAGRRVRESARINSVIVVIKLIIVLLFIVAAAPFVSTGHW